MTPFVLISLASIPLAIKATKGFIGKTEPIEMMPAMGATAKTNTIRIPYCDWFNCRKYLFLIMTFQFL